MTQYLVKYRRLRPATRLGCIHLAFAVLAAVLFLMVGSFYVKPRISQQSKISYETMSTKQKSHLQRNEYRRKYNLLDPDDHSDKLMHDRLECNQGTETQK